MIIDIKEQLKRDFAESFGEMTAQQLWVLTKFAKMVRLRCRSNSAFNNACSTIFPNARFMQVTKTKKDGTTYPGLKIVVKEQEASGEEDV
jgi:hypothetical protein